MILAQRPDCRDDGLGGAIGNLVAPQDQPDRTVQGRRERANKQWGKGLTDGEARQQPAAEPRPDQLLDGLDAAEFHGRLQGDAAAAEPVIDDPAQVFASSTEMAKAVTRIVTASASSLLFSALATS